MGFWLFHLLFLSTLALTVSGQDSIEFFNLCETTRDILKAPTHGELPLAVSVSAENLNGVSSSILKAETWLRSNVLAHYPASKITNIVVGSSAFCQQDQNNGKVLILNALKNVHHSLTRWGLEKEIKVSVAFYLDCLSQNSDSYEDDLKNVKPLMEFLHSVNSTFSVIPNPGFSDFSDKKSLSLISSQLVSMKKLGFFFINNMNIAYIVPKGGKTIARKLSVLDSSLVNAFPLKPTPMPEIAEPPFVGNPNPAPEPEGPEPFPPLAQVVSSPPPMSPSSTFSPQEQPSFIVPASSPHGGFTLPPCNPIGSGSPSPYPHTFPVQKLWCVAKPTVPEEMLQPALDYACGEGGADCAEIAPQGNCYNPDTLIAHASYAFNSYWQKHKRNGGTCSFGGTAMLIHSDPSYLQCQFILK